jgi:hypothetical protein
VITVRPADITYTMPMARSLLNAAALSPRDFTGSWTATTDLIQDNAAVAAADPALGASAARCGRLLGRTVVLQPADLLTAYLSGKPVTAFHELIVYASAAGAADCSAELQQRYRQPGELARALGVFDDPAATQLAIVDFPTVGNESFAATLDGLVTVGPYHAGVNLFLVMFRAGNIVAVVGVVRHHNAETTGPEMLTPLLNILLARIAAAS